MSWPTFSGSWKEEKDYNVQFKEMVAFYMNGATNEICAETVTIKGEMSREF